MSPRWARWPPDTGSRSLGLPVSRPDPQPRDQNNRGAQHARYRTRGPRPHA
jgi:hypothetical protein